MRTKHLLFATALVASFAACSNEDLFDAPQNVAKDGRPTVSDVKLNFTEAGADTRLAFGKNGYAWEETDTIGALLMDQVGIPGTDNWNTEYNLSKYVNTSYPFTYDPAEKIWSSNAKMLEGNYFFAWPWSSYDGARQVKHSLTAQKQKGVSSSVVAQSYADNQLFIGYAQIKGGTAAADALKNVEMTSVLGAIQLRIMNEGTKTYHIRKIELSGTDVVSEFTFDPTAATYTGYNITNSTATCFNYANYLGLEDAPGAVYNANNNYDRMTAIRNVAQASATAENLARLTVEGSDEERAIAVGATGYALIMSQPAETVVAGIPSNQLKLSIYTDEGVIKDKDLTVSYTEWGNVNDGTLHSPAVAKVGPKESNTVVVKFNDASLSSLTTSPVPTDDDLLQLLKWNLNANMATTLTATLDSDNVTFTKEMFDMLKGNSYLTLNIAGNKKLTLAANLPANVLEYGKLNIANTVTTKVKGTVTLTKNTDANAIENLVVEEGAVVNINTSDAVIPGTKLEVNGTLNIGAAANITTAKVITIEAKGVVNVESGASVKASTGSLTNGGKLNNNGYMEKVTNKAEKTIEMGENAVMKGLSNAGTVNVAKGAQVQGTNTGNGIVICLNADVNVNVTSGKVAIAAAGSIAKDAYKNSGINTLILSSEVAFADSQAGIANLIANDGAKIAVANGKKLSVTSVEVSGAVSVKATTGVLAISTLKINKDAVLTNNGEIQVGSKGAAAGALTNEGLVENNGKIYLPDSKFSGTTPTGVGNWKYSDPVKYQAAATTTAYELTVTIKAGASPNNDGLTKANLSTSALTFTTLAAFDAFMKTDTPANKTVTVNKVVIGANLALTTDADGDGNADDTEYFGYLKNNVSGATLELAANLTNLLPSMQLSADKLEVSANATISGTKKLVDLTVNSVNVANGKTLTVVGDILINGTSQIGMGSESVSGDFNWSTNTGRILTKDSSNNYIMWNSTDSVWKAVQ